MRYSQIKAFHNVALYGGFSRAAEAIFQTQPALSEQVRRLEQDHDILMFHRDKKGVRLTAAGEQMFLMTKRFFEVEQQIEEYLSESGAAVEGQLRIIADSAHHVTSHLSRFRRRYPNVFVSLHTGNTTEILNELRTFNAEIGIVGSIDPGHEFHSVDLGSTRITAFSVKGYLPKGITTLSLKDLSNEQLVFREPGSKTRQKLEEEAQRKNITLTPALEVEGREAMREVVAAGTGIGFVSEAEFGNDARLVQIPLRDTELSMSETMVHMATRRDVRVIRAFMDLAHSSPE
ncbi:LysR substrate-binding domain-containing protein [Roseovarius sp. EL26]|uniref:LysR substrate-binding domain-containing protein n=1 Tax=Roseovarius sp. EL26 TaxID=2126672 RepID=UPI000EA14F50|nr:LysR substrate-binding domain-containing protein [Roseovarius sp. EL26]